MDPVAAAEQRIALGYVINSLFPGSIDVGMANMRKHWRNLSLYWDRNLMLMKHLSQVTMSLVVILSLIR